MSWKDIIKYDDYYDEIDHRIYMAQGPQAEIADYNVYGVLYISDETDGYMYIDDYPDVLYDQDDVNLNWKTDNPQTIDQQLKNKLATDFKREFTEISEKDYKRVNQDKEDGKLYYFKEHVFVSEPEIEYALHGGKEGWEFMIDDLTYKSDRFDSIEEAIKHAKEWELME